MNKTEIEKRLENYGIMNYTIHPNLVVDVDGDVDISGRELESLPFQFGTVSGDFSCSCNALLSLQYCPTIVRGNFWCDYNWLRGFDYFPKLVGGHVSCQGMVSNAVFETIPKNHNSWGELIASSKHAYQYLYHPTEEMTNLHKLLWEL